MFERASVDRLVRSMLAGELKRLTGSDRSAAAALKWPGTIRLDEDGIGLDSLQRLEAIAALNTCLRLHETGIEDYLVLAETLDEWVDLCAESLSRTIGGGELGHATPAHAFPGGLTFMTSGSTGDPTPHPHRMRDLIAEIDAHLLRLSARSRVVATTPPHHIYGFLFTVLLPWRASIPTLEARTIVPTSLAGRTRPGDLIVATPFIWQMVARGTVRFPSDVIGVSSGAPAPVELWRDLRQLGLECLVEVYGSTETAGLGTRTSPQQGFDLLPHLELRGKTLLRADGTEIEPPDRIGVSDGRFRPVGRRDHAVQVGGVNVFPRRVADTIIDHPQVADAAVRLDPALGRLKAFVVAMPAADPEQLESDLMHHLRDRLSAVERPAHWRFGKSLPRTEMGKLADWT